MLAVPPVTPRVDWCGGGRGQVWRREPRSEGPFTVASSTRVSFSARPWFPGRRLPAGQRSGKGSGVEDVRDEPLYRSRVCGVDAGKAELYATIRVPSDG